MARTVVKRVGAKDPDVEEIDDDIEDDTEEEVVVSTEEKAMKQIMAECERDATFDVFRTVGDTLANAQIYVRYTIFRDGALLTHRTHPYSWEKLQAEYGGGHYQIHVRHPTKGTFIRKQTQIIHGEPKLPAMHATPKPDVSDLPPQASATPIAPVDPITSMAAVMQAVLAPLTQLLGAVAQRPSSDSNDSSIAKVIEHVNRGQQMQFEMLQQMMRSNMEESKRSMEFQMKILEKVNAQIDASMHKDKDKYSAADVLRATQDAQQAGFQLFAQMQTMASQIAEEKMAMLPPAGEEKKDTITTIIETMAPLIMAGMQKQSGNTMQKLAEGKAPGASPAAHPKPLAFPRVELPRTPAQQASQPAQQPHAGASAGGRPMHPIPRESARAVAQPQPQPALGLPSVRFAKAGATASESASDASGQLSGTPDRDLLLSKWFPILAPHLTDAETRKGEPGFDPLIATIQGLDKTGFDWRQFTSEVSISEVERVCQSIPPEYGVFFRELYGAAEAKARAITPKPPETIRVESSEPANANP